MTINVPEQIRLPEQLPFQVEFTFNAKPKGFGDNHNQAFRLAGTRYFAVLNPDVRLDRDPFPQLIEHLSDPGVGIAAPMVLDPSGKVADSARRLVSPWEVVRRRLPIERRAKTAESISTSPDWVAGIFLVFRSSIYSQLGGFDPRYFLYCEDVDICARARLRGFRIAFVPGSLVVHLAQRASHRSIVRLRMHVASLLRLWSSNVYHEYRRQLRSGGSPGSV